MPSNGEAPLPQRNHPLGPLRALPYFLLLTCALLAGCLPGGEDDRRLAFAGSVRLDSEGSAEITIVARNVSDRLFAQDDHLDGRGEVFNSAQQLLDRFTQESIAKLTAGEETTVATWQGVLEPDTYVMRWTTARYGGVELEFTLLKRFGVLEVSSVRERQLEPEPAAQSPG